MTQDDTLTLEQSTASGRRAFEEYTAQVRSLLSGADAVTAVAH